jgi:hypothetical protein
MSGVCGSVQAAGALGQHPTGSLVTTNIFFVEPTSLSPWRPGRPLLTSPALVMAAAGPATSTPRGPAVKVFNIGGGRYWKSRQQPPRGPPLQHRWWPLPDLPPIAPRGPAIDVSSFGGGRCRTYRQHPQGARHRRLQHRWWLLPDLPPAAPRGAHHRHLHLRWWPLPDLLPAPSREPTIDVSNSGGGRCRKS